MKNFFLAFLLMPFLGLAQTEIGQEWINLPQNVAVGDTITYQQYILDLDGVGKDIRLIQTDIAYNTKKLIKAGEPIWDAAWNSYSKSVNHWVNYNYNPTVLGTDANDLDAQYAEGLGQKYTSPGDWNIQRHTLQATVDIDGVLFTQKFIVADISTSNYTDYTDAVRLNWAYSRDVDYTTITDLYGNPQSLNIADNVGGTPAGTVTFKLETPNAVNIADYNITIEPKSQYDIYSSGGTVNNPVYIGGTFNSSAQFSTTELKQGVEYIVNVGVHGQWDSNTQQSTYPQWLDDVVTVSDVMQVFKQAIGTEPDGTGNVFQYNIQKMLANVKQSGPNDPVDFQDSYALLAHITGILENAANSDTATDFYPITSFNNGSFNWSGFFDTFGTSITSQEEWLAQRKFTIANADPVTITLAHGLMGDADLSHSTTPALNDNTKMTNAVAMSRSRQNIMRAVAQETIDLDVVSQLKNGKVVVEINLSKQDLAGMQFNVNYDKSILTFEDVTFDTGNTMTNFAKHFDDGRVNFGTINIQEENVKTGVPFKLVFTPKTTLQNTIGLVTFRVTDAVKHDGTKVNLNIK